MTTCRLVDGYQQIEGRKYSTQPTEFCDFSLPARHETDPYLQKTLHKIYVQAVYCKAGTFTVYTNILLLNNNVIVHV